MLWSLCAFALTSLMILGTCSKDDDKGEQNNPVAEYGVYVAGNELKERIAIAKLWN